MPEIGLDLGSCEIVAGKHFRNKYMRNWNWDYVDLREALMEARIENVGKQKFEAYLRGKKIIFAAYKEFSSIFVISGSEGLK